MIYSKKKIADALRKSAGRVTTACQYLERAYGRPIHRDTMYGWLQRHPDLREIRRIAESRCVDIAEYNIWRAVKQGNLTYSKYLLDSLGRDRGYGVQRHEVSGPDGVPIASRVELTPDQVEKMSDEEIDDLLNEHSAER